MFLAHVDTGFLAVPNYASTTEEASRLIESIADWSHRISRKQFRATKSGDCEEVLASNNLYPAHSSLKEMLELFDLSSTFSPNDIARLVNNIIERSYEVKNCVGVEVVSVEEYLMEPNLFEEVAPASLRDASNRSLATVMHINASCKDVRAVLVSALPICDPIRIKFSANVEAHETDADGRDILRHTNVEGMATMLSKLDDLCGVVSATSLWESAKDERDLHFAIAVRICEICKGSGGRLLEDVPQFSLGSEFANSLSRVQVAGGQPYAGPALETCAKLILGTASDTSPFKDREGRQKVRQSDGALAWRTHVTKSGLALRLISWTYGDTVELANIGAKHDLVLERGDPSRTYSGDYSCCA